MNPFSLVGPTASGKTQLSYEIAKRFPVEIISMDSMALYKGVPIVTAQPTQEELNNHIHHLVGILEVSEEFSVSDWLERAHTCLREISQRGKLPLIVGGTFLYLHALQQGIHSMPPKDDVTRQVHQDIFDKQGPTALWEKLKEVDSRSAQKLHPNDFKRVSRALEIHALTGVSLSEHRETPPKEFEWDIPLISIEWERQDLYQRAEKRVDQMMAMGLVNEIEQLAETPVSQTFAQAVGVCEVRNYLKGSISQEDMIIEIKKRTRHLVKHQFTWMKKFEIQYLNPAPEKLFEQACQLIENHIS